MSGAGGVRQKLVEGHTGMYDYDIWRARRDVEQLVFVFLSRNLPAPPELSRLSQFLARITE